jgi:hypothetical protein
VDAAVWLLVAEQFSEGLVQKLRLVGVFSFAGEGAQDQGGDARRIAFALPGEIGLLLRFEELQPLVDRPLGALLRRGLRKSCRDCEQDRERNHRDKPRATGHRTSLG